MAAAGPPRAAAVAGQGRAVVGIAASFLFRVVGTGGALLFTLRSVHVLITTGHGSVRIQVIPISWPAGHMQRVFFQPLHVFIRLGDHVFHGHS